MHTNDAIYTYGMARCKIKATKVMHFVQCMRYDACLNVMWSICKQYTRKHMFWWMLDTHHVMWYNMLTVCKECMLLMNAWYTPCDVIQNANSMQGCMCFDDMNAWCLSCNDGWSCYDVMQHMSGACFRCSVYMQNDYAKYNARWHMRHDNDLMCEHDEVKFNEHAEICGC
jgi:hypothetical protein